MSSTSTTLDDPETKAFVTHYIKAQKESGSSKVILEPTARHVASETGLDNNEIIEFCENNDNVDLKEQNGSLNIVQNVDPVGTCPAEIANKFPDYATKAQDQPEAVECDVDYDNIAFISTTNEKLLIDEGFTSFDSILQATPQEIASVGSLTASDAERLQEKALQRQDKADKLYSQYCKRRNRDHTTETGKPDNSQEVDKIPIVTGNPRGNLFAQYGYELRVTIDGKQTPLPINQLPNLTIHTLSEVAKTSNSIAAFLSSIDDFTLVTAQYEAFRQAIKQTYGNNLDALATDLLQADNGEASSDTLQTLSQAIQQPPIKKGPLEEVLSNSDVIVHTEDTPTSESDLKTELKNANYDLPPDAIVQILDAVKTYTDSNTIDQTSFTTEDILQASRCELIADHPKIPNEAELPEIKTVPGLPDPTQANSMKLGGDKADTDDYPSIMKLVAERIVLEDNKAIDLVGEAGVGKDVRIKVLAAKTNTPVLTLNVSAEMGLTEMLGQFTATDGTVEFDEKFLPLAMKYDWWLILSEVNLAYGEVLTKLNKLLDEHGRIYIDGDNKYITSCAGFQVFYTRNPPTNDFEGRKSFGQAMQRRTYPYIVPRPSISDEVKILAKQINSEKPEIKHATRDTIRDLVEVGHHLDDERAGEQFSELPRLTGSDIKEICYDMSSYPENTDLSERGIRNSALQKALRCKQLEDTDDFDEVWTAAQVPL